MNLKLAFISFVLTIFSLFYVATHDGVNIDVKINSELSNVKEDSIVMQEAYFYGINSNFFKENSPELFNKKQEDFDIYKKAKFWGINVLSK